MKETRVIVLIVFVLVLLIPFVSILDSEFKKSESGEIIIEMTTKQFSYSPNQLTVSEGDYIKLIITSLDVSHGFQLEEFNIYNFVIPGGSTVELSFQASKSGMFKFYCTVFCGTGHANHSGTLIVE